MLHAEQGGAAEEDHRRVQVIEEAVMDSDVKEVVREKYGQAARPCQVRRGQRVLWRSRRRRGTCDPITSNLYAPAGRRGAGAGAEGVARLRQSHRAGGAEARARPSSTSARAAASTCCSRRGGSGRPARPTAST